MIKKILKNITISFIPIDLVTHITFEFRSKLGRLFARDLKFLTNNNRNIFINLGCGDTYNKNFINVDFFSNRKIDYGMDLRYPFKIETNSIDGIFSEHTFEHLSHQEVDNVLSESYRILKTGGKIRIIVPDLSIFIKKYYNNDEAWFQEWHDRVLQHPSRHYMKKYFTKMFAINFTANFYMHKTCWDFETLEKKLSVHGFIDIKQYDFNIGTPELLIDRDSEDRKMVSIYVEGTKG